MNDLSKAPSPATVAYVRRRYAEGILIDQIEEESELSRGVIYQCVDGKHDDGSGLPVSPLPRRKKIPRRRPSVPHVRATLAGRLWRAAEGQVREIEKRLERAELATDNREREAKVLAMLVRTMRELKAIDSNAKPPATANAASASEDHDPVPRDIDDFRRRLAEKIDRLAAQERAAAGGGASS